MEKKRCSVQTNSKTTYGPTVIQITKFMIINSKTDRQINAQQELYVNLKCNALQHAVTSHGL